ncbi:MAG: hypothetical protein HZB92_06600 [Euryarchaeota archaeon]|nr:hypothetical protein [Euryarchaeota archaeon]
MIDKKWAIAGAIVAAIVLSALGASMAVRGSEGSGAQESASSPQQAATDNGTMRFLITREQAMDLRNLTRELLAQNLTRDEIEAQVQAASDAYMVSNMQSYGLADSEIDAVMAKLHEIREQRALMRQTMDELRSENATSQQAREEMQPLAESLRQMQADLGSMLEQYGIAPFPPPHGGHGPLGRGRMGHGCECGQNGGMGLGGGLGEGMPHGGFGEGMPGGQGEPVPPMP